jgi:hypothetical protein
MSTITRIRRLVPMTDDDGVLGRAAHERAPWSFAQRTPNFFDTGRAAARLGAPL